MRRGTFFLYISFQNIKIKFLPKTQEVALDSKMSLKKLRHLQSQTNSTKLKKFNGVKLIQLSQMTPLFKDSTPNPTESNYFNCVKLLTIYAIFWFDHTIFRMLEFVNFFFPEIFRPS